MSGESDFIDRLAQSIADGASINWDEEIDRLPADDKIRGLVALLRMVDGVAEVHRSLSDPSQATGSVDAHAAAAGPVHQESGIGQWGHLVLRRKIGEGGFGEVYHAYDTWLDHSVALKLFKPKVTNRDSANRILHEARKLARIRHPNIVTVHGADSHNGQVGFWMDLIEGTTLEQIVRTGRLSAGEAAYIGQEVCRALAAVHLAGIVHRDVKAQNVMRATDGGRIILMDFGAGEFMKDQAASTRKQGTPLYVAPEIFMGEDASVRSDIYAAGVLLYYLVTNSFPVRGASVADLVEAHRHGRRRRLRDARPDLPGSFVSIVERALDPDPARRFASAGEMEAALTGGTVVPTNLISVERVQSNTHQRSTVQRIGVVGGTAAGALLAIGVLGLIACRVFDVALGIPPDFSAGVVDYFFVGAYALLPFLIFWSAGAGIVAGLIGMRSLFRRPLATLRKALPATGPIEAEVIASLVFLAGVACWVAINWYCFSLFTALEGLRVGATAPAVAMLGSGARPLHLTHANSSAILSFLLGLALWRWFPALEARAVDPSRVRPMKWATAVVAFMVVATAVVPRRLIWENFEVVRFENRPAFVIRNNGDELLLYYPYDEAAKQRRVRVDAPGLERDRAKARIFDKQ
jgi:serine/threonine-protein kinase